jgi:hypothetical protein
MSNFIKNDKFLTRFIPLLDMMMIKLLIDSLDSIDTNEQAFTVPPLPGEVNIAAIYKRNCYDYYRDFILNNTAHNRFLITGNPGIGKTYFGRLMLVELLQRGKEVLFDCKDCTLYINPRGEYFKVNSEEYKLIAPRENTWCIIDGRAPQISHDWSAGKFIMVSSPKRAIIKDFDKPRCKTLYMPTWNEEELLKCWESLYKDKISGETIKKKLKLCGGIPRWIFDNEMTLEKIRNMIIAASESIDQCIIEYQAKLFFGHEFSHKIIHIHPNVEGMNPYTDAICLFASKYAAVKCLNHLKKHNKQKLRTFIESARNLKEMGSLLRGQLFELLSHEILSVVGEEVFLYAN